MKTMLSFACVVLLAPGVSMAAPELTLGIRLNHSTVESTDLLPPPLHWERTTTLHDEFSGTGPRISVGLGFTNWVGFEAGWSEFGTRSGSVTLTFVCPGFCAWQPPPEIHEVEQSGHAYWIAYRPRVRLRNWDFSGKLGTVRVASKTSGTTYGRIVESSTETMLGVGMTYWFSDTMGAVFDAESMGGRVVQYGLGVEIRF